jgi:hypothetical protein
MIERVSYLFMPGLKMLNGFIFSESFARLREEPDSLRKFYKNLVPVLSP